MFGNRTEATIRDYEVWYLGKLLNYSDGDIRELQQQKALPDMPLPAAIEAQCQQVLADVAKAERQLHSQISTNGNCGEKGWWPR